MPPSLVPPLKLYPLLHPQLVSCPSLLMLIYYALSPQLVSLPAVAQPSW